MNWLTSIWHHLTKRNDDMNEAATNDQGLAAAPATVAAATAPAPVAAVAAAPVADPAPAPAPVAPQPAVTDDFLVKLKGLLMVLGHDLESAWDDAVALAKKAV
jgi:microcystin-dependent protein